MARDPSTVAVLVFDRAPMFETSVPISVFGLDRTSSGAPAFDLRCVAAEPGPLVTTGGVGLDAPHGLDALDDAGIVVIPGWRDPAEPPPGPAVAALRAAHADGAVAVSLCMGAFVLAATGLLDGRRVATHWYHAPMLAARYPSITVDPTVLFVDDGDVVTGAGTSAGIDACLHIVRRFWGAGAAASIARRMVVAPARRGGQAQFIERPVVEATGDPVVDVLMAAATELAGPVDVDTLAARALVSRRTFDRRVRAATGASPRQWLAHQRMLGARRLLEDSDLSVGSIGRRVGFSSPVTFRESFRRAVGVSPQDYRRSFRAGG